MCILWPYHSHIMFSTRAFLDFTLYPVGTDMLVTLSSTLEKAHKHISYLPTTVLPSNLKVFIVSYC